MHLVSPTDVLPDLPLMAELATTLTFIDLGECEKDPKIAAV